MRKICALFLCIAALSGLCACGGGDAVRDDPPLPPVISNEPDAMAQEITVMSFNVWTRGIAKRKNGVAQTILGEMPDSVGLQEARGQWRLFLRRELKGSYAMACGTGRVAGMGEGVPILYRSDKYDLVDEGVFWLSERPNFPIKGWDAKYFRIVGWAVLKDKTTGFIYVHFNAHFDNKGSIARANSARLVADRINEMGLPAVFTGDVNCVPGDLPARYLELGGLTDLRMAAADTDTGGTLPGSDTILDYIYANYFLRGAKEFKVIRDQYDGMYPSDHFAICATLTLAN